MKKQLLLLVSILLPLISSCNVEPTIEPTSGQTTDSATELTSISTTEPSEEIYYLDGLASNLFVTEVPENVDCYYEESTDCYSAYADTNEDGIIYKDIDCIIPNVYDDGIHGLKRIKIFDCSYLDTPGYYNKLIISEGIEMVGTEIGHIAAREIYFPSTLKTISCIWGWQSLRDEAKENIKNKTRYYNGTIAEFKKIEGFISSSCLLEDTPYSIKFICLDGDAYFDFYFTYYI